MGKETFWDKIVGVYYHIEWYFARRWLDRNFGKQEYWGDYLTEKLK